MPTNVSWLNALCLITFGKFDFSNQSEKNLLKSQQTHYSSSIARLENIVLDPAGRNVVSYLARFIDDLVENY